MCGGSRQHIKVVRGAAKKVKVIWKMEAQCGNRLSIGPNLLCHVPILPC